MSSIQPIDNNQNIPKEMDIFFRDITAFLPDGKTFNDLTAEEKEKVKNQYRFDPFKPGIYQGITGKGRIM